jgi:hypothetical protein
LDTNSAAPKKDGRIYQASIAGDVVSTSGANIEYLDYPKCTATATGTEDHWICQLYLPMADQQTDGYPRFADGGVIKGHSINSFLPAAEDLSYNTATADLHATSTTTYAAALLAAVSALMF